MVTGQWTGLRAQQGRASETQCPVKIGSWEMTRNVVPFTQGAGRVWTRTCVYNARTLTRGMRSRPLGEERKEGELTERTTRYGKARDSENRLSSRTKTARCLDSPPKRRVHN